MKAFIFCGGKATRFNKGKPGPLKPLIKVNKYTILENILFNLEYNSLEDVYILGGYKIKELNNFLKKINIKNLKITLINSGVNTNTGGRLLYIKKYINKNEKFLLTYGDTIVNYIHKEAFKKIKKDNEYVISCYKKEFNYGRIISLEDNVKIFEEKKPLNINAGYYIFDNKIFKFILRRSTSLEKDVLPKIISNKKIKLKINYVDKWIPIDNIKDLNKAKKKVNI